MINPIVMGMYGQPVMFGRNPIATTMNGDMVIGGQAIRPGITGRPTAIGRTPAYFPPQTRTSRRVADLPVIRNQSGEPGFALFPPLTPTAPRRNPEPDTRIAEIIPWLINRPPTKINPY